MPKYIGKATLEEMKVDSSGAAAARRLVMSAKDRREGLDSAESIPNTATARRAHFRTMLNHGAYASVGLQRDIARPVSSCQNNLAGALWWHDSASLATLMVTECKMLIIPPMSHFICKAACSDTIDITRAWQGNILTTGCLN